MAGQPGLYKRQLVLTMVLVARAMRSHLWQMMTRLLERPYLIVLIQQPHAIGCEQDDQHKVDPARREGTAAPLDTCAAGRCRGNGQEVGVQYIDCTRPCAVPNCCW